jgi:uncharacterized membrane protein YtjA (UPF0391 family)
VLASILKPKKKLKTMLRLAIIFFVIAIIAILLGFGGVGALASEIGYFLAVLALIFFVINLVTRKT